MAYIVNRTDGVVIATIADGTIDTTSSSIVLLGKGFNNYGEIVAENWIHMIEHFANATPPSNAMRGQLWYDTNGDRLHVNVSTVFGTPEWVSAGKAYVQGTAPDDTAGEGFAAGTFWFDTVSSRLHLSLDGATFTPLRTVSVVSSLPSLSTVEEGELYYDTTTRELKIVSNDLHGSAAKGYDVVGPPRYSATEPSTLVGDGDLWYDSVNKQIQVFDGSLGDYRLVGPLSNTTLGDGTTVLATDSPPTISILANSSTIATFTDTAITVNENVLPDSDITRDIGASGTKFSNIWGETLHASSEVSVASLGTADATVSIVTAASTADSKIEFGDAADDDVGRIIYDHDTDAMTFWANAAQRAVINSAGRLGVAVTSPQSLVHVHGGASNAYAQFTTNTTGSTSGDGALIGVTVSNSELALRNQENAAIGLWTNGSKRVHVAGAGNVGINTATPGYTLEVQGDTNITGNLFVGGSPITSASIPTGGVIPYAGTSAPTGFLFCYGQAVSRTTYSDLFSTVGTTYGNGNGSTTFNLPDLRGRVVAGKDNMGGTSANRLTPGGSGLNGDVLGNSGGDEEHTLTIDEMPRHRHTLTAAIVAGQAEGGSGDNEPADTSINTSFEGNDQPHNNVQPTFILNYIIKT